MERKSPGVSLEFRVSEHLLRGEMESREPLSVGTVSANANKYKRHRAISCILAHNIMWPLKLISQVFPKARIEKMAL